MKNMTIARQNARDGLMMTLPLVLGCLVFYAVPFLLVLRNSLYHGIGRSELFVGLGNYSDMLGNGVFRLAFGNTLKFLAISLPLMLVLSFAIALLLKKQAEQYKTLKSVLLLPYIMPVVGTILLIELIFTETGLMNNLLTVLGLPVVDWMGSEKAFVIVIALYLWKNAGYSIFFTMVFSLINAFKCFREIFLIGGTHPHTSIYMLQHFINNAFDKLNYPKLAVASVLLLLVLTTLFAAGYRWVQKKEAYKG